jgi:hypothetical protein
MDVVRGSVGDRPWGVVLGKLGLEAFSGQLSIRGDAGKTYQIAFVRGVIVGATSPLTADSVARVALTRHLITTTHVAEIQKRIAEAPDQDEVEIVRDLVNLEPVHVHRLRHRLIAQRAARTFAIERGDYTLDERITIRQTDARLDIRNVIYLGVRMNLSEDRLGAELRQLGARFMLERSAIADLARFGFTDAEKPVLEALRTGASLPELEARHRDIDPRTMQAIVYALAACGAAQPVSPQGSGGFDSAVAEFRQSQPTLARGTRSDLEGPANSVLARGTMQDIRPDVPRTKSKTQPPVTPLRHPATIRRDAMVTRPTRPPEVAAAPAAPPPSPAVAALEAFQRGETALRADLVQKAIVELRSACELAPNNVFYLAMLRWAQFCGSAEKRLVAAETRKALELAVYKSDRPDVARFYLGRVERMLGRDAEALRHFREVLDADPRHADAASEIRIIEKRLASRR